MELIEGLEPPDVSACTGLETAMSAQEETPAHQSAEAAAAGSPPPGQPAAAGGKDFTRTSRNQPFLDQQLDQQLQEEQEQQEQGQQEQQQERQQQLQQQQQQEEMAPQNPASSTLFSMASCDGVTNQATHHESVRRATSAAYPGCYSPSRLSAGPSPGLVRRSATEMSNHPAAPAVAAPVRQTTSAHNLAPVYRTASLPSAVLRSSGKLQHHQSLRSPFEDASEGSGACQRRAPCVQRRGSSTPALLTN